MKNIVVTDSGILEADDLSWDEFKKVGNVTIYNKSTYDEVIPRAKDADILVVNKCIIDKHIIDNLSNVKCICLFSTGFNVVDVDYAKQKGIAVCNVPTYCTKAVIQSTFALLFALTNSIAQHSASVRQGDWANSPTFTYQVAPLIELENKTMGIIGYGNIGKGVAQIAHTLGMNVLVSTRSKVEMPEFCKDVELDYLFNNSDVISLNCPLTDKTQKMINKENIAKMKKSAIIINTSRGGVINEEDLADALNNDRIYGCAVDVLSTEPPKADNPMLTAKNCFITPHIAWAARESRQRLIDTVVENMKMFINETPQNVVNS